MTEIRERIIPNTEKSEPPEVQSGANRFVFVLAVASITLTAINLVAGYYVIDSSRGLHVIEDRLQRMQQIEKNVIASVNDLQKVMQGRLQEMEERTVKKIQADLARVPYPGRKTENSVPVLSDNQAQNQGGDGDLKHLTVPEAASSNSGETGDGQNSSVSYERIESADGKVFYRKVR